ncbi:EAL domain-containing protein [Cellulomonas sp. RIT-PI-Y]|uniref:EAL and HDOD domain-containing protein n=1 Tax=Cellulomonas sp. RIT-PI-Y TaxID=3035297 RepID=UPI0021D7E0DC|nr:EAL domain-containing protein [Cellulomonas sp. RIT-PI-Y]
MPMPHRRLAAGPAHQVCVARQGIHDVLGRTIGHELLFRPSATAETSGLGGVETPDDNRATASVIAATLTAFGVDDLAGHGDLFVNVPRSFLVDELPVALDPHRVVLEVLEHVPPDEQVQAGIAALRDRGFGIALDDMVPDDPRWVLLPLADYVKVDMSVLGEDLAAFAAQLHEAAPLAALVAERVETEDDLRAAQDAGFPLFQGYYFRRPTVFTRPALAHHAVVAGRLLVQLGDPQVSYRRLARLTAADPAIALKVFRIVNSVSGAGRTVRHLHQALVLLGRERLRAMLVLEVLATAGHHDDEIPLAALARTRAAEILAPHDALEASTEALVRMMSDLLSVPVAELDPQLRRRAPSVAVLQACDVLDDYLDAMGSARSPLIPPPFTGLQVSMVYLTALREARALLATVYQPVGTRRPVTPPGLIVPTQGVPERAELAAEVPPAATDR